MAYELRLEPKLKTESVQGHTIEILNFKKWTSVRHPIIIIKGSISHTICNIGATFVSVDGEKSKLGPRNRFKALVRLKPGSNAIKMVYCCVEQIFELIYEQIIEPIRFVRPLYVVFRDHDGSFQAPDNVAHGKEDGLARIDLNCQLIQAIVAEKLHENGLMHHTFQLTSAQFFHSKIAIEKSRELYEDALFHELAVELEKSHLASSKVKHIAFVSGTQYRGELYRENMNHEDLLKITNRYIALGCGALALFHTACLFTWPKQLQEVVAAFEDATLVDLTQLLADGNNRVTWGACYSTTLGAVLHELCHTFDLGHANDGVMSRGFDDVRDVFLVDGEPAIDADRRRGFHARTDSTKIHASGAVILRYHKWFQSDISIESPYILSFDMEHRLLRSTFGVRVIEVRAGDTEMLQQFWIFNTPRMHLQLALKELEEKSVLFVEDIKGNIIKVALNSNI